eukprot:2470018-Rhodomonas_salina.1
MQKRRYVPAPVRPCRSHTFPAAISKAWPEAKRFLLGVAGRGEAHKTTYIFTGGYDHTARCFNAETGECLFIYRGHRSFVFCLRVGQENEKEDASDDMVENIK